MARKPQPVTAASWAPPADWPRIGRSDDTEIVSAWQAEAWQMWHRLGEIHYPTSYKARAVGRVDWLVTRNGVTLEPEAGDALLAEATDPLGVSEAARLLALNLEVAGDVWWLAFDDDGTLRWAVYSVVTPKLKEKQEAAALKLRQWIPDPTNPKKADSPIRAALDPAEELVTLTGQSRAQSMSRIVTAGLLLHPSEVVFPDDDPFGDDLLAAMETAMADPTSPSALVPIAVEMPGDRIEQVRWEIPDRPYDEHLGPKIEATIRRIAIALDVPAEMLTGLGDVNHWGQWLEQEETYRAHVEPTAVQVGQVFAWSLEQTFSGDFEVEPSVESLVRRPPQLADLSIGYQLGVVTADEWREAAGLPPGAPPSPPVLQTVPPVPESNGGGGAPVAAAVELGVALTRIDAELRDALVGALEAYRSTARNRVGAKLRSDMQRERRPAYGDIPNADLAAALGDDMAVPWAADIVGETLEPLGRWWDRRLVEASAQVESIAAIDTATWDDERALSVAGLVAEATAWIVDGLGSDTLDAGAQVVARRAVARAGGVVGAVPVAVP